MTAPLVIFDTDFSSDIDDLGDLTVMLAYHRLGHINLIGVVVDTTNDKSPGAVRAVCIARNQGTTIPVYSYQPGSTFNPNGPTLGITYLYDNYPHTGIGLSNTCTTDIVGYRTLLANAASPVTIIATGFATSLDALMQSPADGISALTGAQLIAAKVKALYWVAGIWPATGTGEFNLVQAPSQANHLVANWPSTVPLVFIGIENGDQAGLTGASLATNLPSSDAVRVGYAQAGYSAGRTCWGQVGVMAAVESEAPFQKRRGTATVNASTGFNSFTFSNSGAHAYLSGTDFPSIQAHLEELLGSAATDPPLTAWSARAFVNATVV